MNSYKNYGYNPILEKEHQSVTDYLVGSNSLPSLFTIHKDERERYLPKGELQNIGEDKMDCATRSPLNKLETDFTYAIINRIFNPSTEKWLRDNGYVIDGDKVEFSDAFNAIKSGTTREGNSLIRPLDSIHSDGLIPKARLPQLNSFDEHYNPMRITDELTLLGKEFARRFLIRYERANESQFEEILENEMLCTGGYAWPVPVNGEYPRVEYQPNHAFMLFKNPKFYAFDNYIDSVDGDFIKKLAPDYDFIDVGYRVFICEERVIEPQRIRGLSLWQKIVNIFLREKMIFKFLLKNEK